LKPVIYWAFTGCGIFFIFGFVSVAYTVFISRVKFQPGYEATTIYISLVMSVLLFLWSLVFTIRKFKN